MICVRKSCAPLVVAAISLLAASCADDDGGDTTSRLDGRSFLSQSIEGHVLVPGTQVVVTFDGDAIGARAGCNSLGATYRVDDGHIVIADGTMSTTEMGCEPQFQAQDEWLSEFIQSEPELELVGNTLTLSTADATLQLLDRVVADPDRPLLGTIWRVDTILRGDAASTVPDDAPVTLEFRDDGTLIATSAGCNTAIVNVQKDDDTIAFADFVIDLIGCPAPWAETIELLQTGSATYSITAARLTLTADGIGLSAVAD